MFTSLVKKGHLQGTAGHSAASFSLVLWCSSSAAAWAGTGIWTALKQTNTTQGLWPEERGLAIETGLHLLSSDYQISNCSVEKEGCFDAVNKLIISLCRYNCFIFMGMSLCCCLLYCCCEQTLTLGWKTSHFNSIWGDKYTDPGLSSLGHWPGANNELSRLN